jgi:transcriptional regulator with XRE-family HTH domain
MAAGPKYAAAAELGRRLRARRTELGWSQIDLGHVAGVHFTVVSDIELGKRNTSLLTLLRLASALDIDPGALIAGLAPPEPMKRRQGRK